MDVRMSSTKLLAAASLTTLALLFLSADAMAAKAKFERSKPHVNVGTIGHVDQEPGDLTNPDGNSATSPDTDRSGEQCVPDPSKPADAQAC